MLMGEGKTTVIGPLLALFFADKRSLVTQVVAMAITIVIFETVLLSQVVPSALLDMSRNVMWSRFTVRWFAGVFIFLICAYPLQQGGLEETHLYSVF